MKSDFSVSGFVLTLFFAGAVAADPAVPVDAPAPVPIPVPAREMPAPARPIPVIEPVVDFGAVPVAEPVKASDLQPEGEALPGADDAQHDGPSSFSILGETVEPGKARRLSWAGIDFFVGGAVHAPVVVAHGVKEGPVVCLTGAVHGDELNGIEIVRRVMFGADPKEMAGTLVGIPIVNIQGFQRASRYLPDRRDLNRYFPGDPNGSSASRIAYDFFENVVRKCDELIDLHTGSFHRTNLTQLRADLTDDRVRDMTEGFGDMAVLHNVGSTGTLRGAAVLAGIPTVTVEAGEPMRLDTSAVEKGVEGIRNYLAHREMIERIRIFGKPQPIYYRSTWIRADRGGILFSLVRLGDTVDVGEELGTVTDPITNGRAIVTSPFAGTVLGKAVNQFVMPGFALYRIGVETSDEDLESFLSPTVLPGADAGDDHVEEPAFGAEERPE